MESQRGRTNNILRVPVAVPYNLAALQLDEHLPC